MILIEVGDFRFFIFLRSIWVSFLSPFDGEWCTVVRRLSVRVPHLAGG